MQVRNHLIQGVVQVGFEPGRFRTRLRGIDSRYRSSLLNLSYPSLGVLYEQVRSGFLA